MRNLYEDYLKVLDSKDASVYFGESLRGHCSFDIGGKAKYFVVVHNKTTLVSLLKKNKRKKFYILGAGTNTLFSDKFYKGTIIKLGEGFRKIKMKKISGENVTLEVGAGVNLFALNSFLRENAISGLEWSYGIPGSVGGATIMNAGSYDHEFGEFVSAVRVLKDGKSQWVKDFNFSYRNSSFKRDGSIILSVRLNLKTGQVEEITENQNFFINKKRESQPYGEKSAGSVFKRIIKKQGIFYPAKIIDTLGLKGVKIGGAEVSEKHAGFIINDGNAKAKDVIRLIRLIKRRVKKESGEKLETEIIIF